MANARAMEPAERAPPQLFDKTLPLSIMPQNMITPLYKGNYSRQFLDQDLYELTTDRSLALPKLLAYSVFTTNTNVLTTRCWPKVKLPEGVQQITQTIFDYNVIPTTNVPMRGTVRFMSKQTRSFTAAITQKGIGSVYEGSALASEFGPQLIAMDIRAYAESIDQGQAINTAISLVNTANRAPLLVPGIPYRQNFAQHMARELPKWCSLGVNPTQILNDIEELLAYNPKLDTVLIPDKFRESMVGGAPGREVPFLMVALDQNGEFQRVGSVDRLESVRTLVNGKLDVFDMTQFKIKNSGRSFQPLETVNTIGEVYFMTPEKNPMPDQPFSSNSLAVYLYDERHDTFKKILPQEAVRYANIWERDNYSPHFQKYLSELAGYELKSGQKLQFPVSKDKAPGDSKMTAFLPRFWGNIDRDHMDEEQIEQAVDSIVSQLVHNHFGGKVHLAYDRDQISNLERLRATIEHEAYNHAYWERVAELNIGRSIRNGRFVGKPTGMDRARDYEVAPIQEWVPNVFGGMDVPDDMPNAAGMFSAAGFQTLAALKNHPLASSADQAYNFLTILENSVSNIVRKSAILSPQEMPINMPIYNKAQLVLTALMGPRVPVFLAAPDDLVVRAWRKMSDADNGNGGGVNPSSTDSGPSQGLPLRIRIYGADPSDVEADSRITFTGNDDSTIRSSARFARYPSGLTVQIPDEAFVATADAIPWKNIQLDPDLRKLLPKDGAEALESYLSRFFWGTLKKSPQDIEAEAVTILKFVDYLAAETSEEARTEAIATFTNGSRRGSKFQALLAKIDSFRGERYSGWMGKAMSYFMNLKPVEARSDLDVNLAEAYKNLHRAMEQIIASNPEAAKKFENRYIRLGLQMTTKEELKLAELEALKIGRDLLQDLSVAIDQLKSSVGKNKALFDLGAKARQIQAEIDRSPPNPNLATKRDVSNKVSISIASLMKAKYFRCPMNFSFALLTSLNVVQTPWIAPGDIKTKFQDYVKNVDGFIASQQWSIPHFLATEHDAASRMRIKSWHDVSVYSRLSLLAGGHGASSAPLAASGLPNARSSSFIESAYDAMDVETPDEEIARHQEINNKGDRYREAFRGGMIRNLSFVFDNYSDRPVHRFVALAFLNSHCDSLPVIIDLVSNNVHLPFEIWLWRLFSQHLTGSVLVMVSGIESGANFYNGAKYTISFDGDRNVYHTRAVITTDAVAIRPENHMLIRNVQPRQYITGHATDFITKAADADETVVAANRPSIIATVVPERSSRRTRFPVSFINKVPAQIIPGNPEFVEPDLELQNFPGAYYYGFIVYRGLFEELLPFEKANFDITPAPNELNFSSDANTRNHLAFLGYNVRYDYPTQKFAREVVGNGHRANRKLNHPGAKDYLNGSGGPLPVPLPIAQYGLY